MPMIKRNAGASSAHQAGPMFGWASPWMSSILREFERFENC
jgi:hypothetical protein